MALLIAVGLCGVLIGAAIVFVIISNAMNEALMRGLGW